MPALKRITSWGDKRQEPLITSGLESRTSPPEIRPGHRLDWETTPSPHSQPSKESLLFSRPYGQGCCGLGVCCFLLWEGSWLEACHSYHFLLGALVSTLPNLREAQCEWEATDKTNTEHSKDPACHKCTILAVSTILLETLACIPSSTE